MSTVIDTFRKEVAGMYEPLLPDVFCNFLWVVCVGPKLDELRILSSFKSIIGFCDFCW